MDLAMQIMQKFIEQLGNKITIEQPISNQFGRLSTIKMGIMFGSSTSKH